MQDWEYKKKHHPELYKRSWLFTLVTALLAVFVLVGIIASWRYLGHDAYVIGSVIIPAVLVLILLITAAINGRKKVIKDFYAGVLEMLFWWWP